MRWHWNRRHSSRAATFDGIERRTERSQGNHPPEDALRGSPSRGDHAMASSFVRFGDHGFWVSDWVLEYWLHFLANEVDKVSQAPLWLQEAGQHWRIQSARICVGCVDVGLDEYATTPERKAALVAIGREAQRTLQSLDEEEEISLESGSLPASDLPVGEIMDLAVQFVRLLGGDVTSPMSSEDVYRVIQRSTERGKATAFLGHSPLAQPKDVFTFPRYRRYIREATRAWWRAREKYLADRPVWGRIRESLKPLLRQYIPRLPIYLLARCPICEGNVSESCPGRKFHPSRELTARSVKSSISGHCGQVNPSVDRHERLVLGVNLSVLSRGVSPVGGAVLTENCIRPPAMSRCPILW
jgi:hypothetical protein